MDNNFHLISIVEGNAFSLVLPLKKRTYQSCRPIDEDIDATQLTNLVVKFGGVEYEASVDEQGVRIDLPATLALGMYSIVLTATYQGSEIRAAYESAVKIVTWNEQSDAQQYIQGSPLVLEAAYVIGGTLTDAELEALKAEYRERNAELAQATADMEAAKEHYDELAEQLQGVAQEQTLTQGVADIREDISHIDIDTSTLAKQGTNASATLTATQTAATNAYASAEAAKQAADDAKSAALALPSAQEVAQAVIAGTRIPVSVDGLSLLPGTTIENGLDLLCATNNITEINISRDTYLTSIFGTYGSYLGYNYIVYPWALFQNLKRVIIPICSFDAATNNIGFCDTLQNLEYVDIRNAYNFRCNRLLTGCTNLKYVNILNLQRANTDNYRAFIDCPNLIDIVWGGSVATTPNLLAYWSPTNALRNDISTLVDEGETFANNLEKLLYNIREHIAANIPDRTGQSSLTMTFSAAVKAAILADAATMTAFTNKNWTIA